MSNNEQWTAAQFQAYYKKKQGSNAHATRLKYGNKPVVIDNIRFDSIKEGEYYGQLKIRQRIGQIIGFEVHKVYPLMVNGILIASYEADFVLLNPDLSHTVQDVKSEATEGLPVFLMKKALMLAIYGIEVQIIK